LISPNFLKLSINIFIVIAECYKIENESNFIYIYKFIYNTLYFNLKIDKQRKINNFIQEIIKNNDATLLSKTVHHFDDNGAFTSLYLLAESHLSIHTWPENNFMAIDVFTCGKTNTQNIVNELKNYIKPQYCDEYVKIRGI
jgi:S-adenosylmethionine decarboxylase